MIILLAAAVLPAAFLLYRVYKMDTIEKEPWSILRKLLLWGALSGIPAALVESLLTGVVQNLLQEGTLLYNFVFGFIVAALVEESFKFFFLYKFTFKNPAFNYRFDGVVYAVFVSMGFAILENILEKAVYPESFARTVMACMGIDGDQVFRPVRLLSGGEKAKAALGKLMLMDCNTLLLDEPTNHLDLFTMEELERLLAGYGGTLLFVSHDEEFIRKTATRIIRFEDRKLVTCEEGWEAAAAEKRRDPGAEERRLEISRIEMRMAVLTARMAAPKKGDRPEMLQEEYMRLAEKLRELSG